MRRWLQSFFGSKSTTSDDIASQPVATSAADVTLTVPGMY